MSAGLYVIGFRPPDEKWRRMKAIWDACIAGNVELPAEVADFFEGGSPSENGMKVELYKILKEFNDPDSASEGYELKLTDLPSGITSLRFYVSW